MRRNLPYSIIVFVAVALINIVSCKKELIKGSAVSPIVAALLADSNFVTMSVAGTAAVQNTLVIHQVHNKAVNSLQGLMAKQILDSLAAPNASNPSYYIFNYIGGGFAIISADKRVQPILAYSDYGYFDSKTDMNPGLTNWMTVTDQNMQLLRSHHELKASKKTAQFWACLLKNKPNPVTTNNGLTVNKLAPVDTCQEYVQIIGVDSLLRTSWDQKWPYNADCPTSAPYPVQSFSNGFMAAGCVATAMAQIMNYWKYPAASPYGGFTYDYSSIPAIASVTTITANPSLAKLIKDAGESVDMEYSDLGSSPYVDDAWFTTEPTFWPADGLHAFGYNANHSDYSDGNYSDVIANLNNHWPVIFSGLYDSNNGHTWVCDGYQEFFFYTCDADDLSQPADVSAALIFHMNWGLNGLYDGYYAYNSWTVSFGGPVEFLQYDRKI